ncbi:C4-dicarboxylate ABC transporter substrate-binding protein [Bosea caraganae]|uniref:C4-dicarboxylate ABC transporter substrate-binding protein n=1 Tax=Bosea caraganae TaxID=2763117 RepID=A0A370L1E1_9HYPH|nr:TRAP transporter substrate-binding protein [Bosea caraganae]RDJ21315.1 C4-dicarboxylate ABC transporter substrate-binding protein [Bosea caraganae]RDJ26455.1 C4-dicarboxylate ABC transporter substrate-binding protein [Bosea caraganae]
MPMSRRTFTKLGLGSLGGALSMPAIVAAQAPIAFRVSSSMPADQNAAHFIWFERFQTALRERVGDKLKLDFFPNSQLGKEADIVQQVTIGGVDMMISGSSIWATQVPEIGMLDLGYLFDGYEQAGKLLDGAVGQAFDKIMLERSGVTILGWGFHFGARCVYTKAKAVNLAELKSVKLRVLPARAFIETFTIMGAVPTPIPFNELYTALQSGVVDGFEHDAASVLANRLYEVTKFCLETNHLYSPMTAVMGRRGLAKVPADLKKGFLEAAKVATEGERKDAASKGAAATEQLKQMGIAFTPFPAVERKQLQGEMSEKLYAAFAAQYPATKPLFDAVKASLA